MDGDALIGVTGATGQIGRRVAAALAARGLPQRLVVRDSGRAPSHPGAHVRQASGYGAAGEMREALEGVRTLLLIPAEETPDRVEQHRTAVDAAVAAGVRRLVYLSFVGASPDATFTLARHHWATEEHIRATGLPWTFLRMNLYLDILPLIVGPDGVIRGPAGDGRLAGVARDDVAAAAVAVLTGEGHDGRTYELTGPEALDFGEVATLLSEVSGTTVRFVDETEEQAYASRAHYGAGEEEVRGWVSSYLAIRDGSMASVSSDVQRLTGRPARSLRDLLVEQPDLLAPLRP